MREWFGGCICFCRRTNVFGIDQRAQGEARGNGILFYHCKLSVAAQKPAKYRTADGVGLAFYTDKPDKRVVCVESDIIISPRQLFAPLARVDFRRSIPPRRRGRE